MNVIFYCKPSISSAEISKISQRFAKVSKDGYLSKRIYLLTVDGLIPNFSAISFCDNGLYSMASRNRFWISSSFIMI